MSAPPATVWLLWYPTPRLQHVQRARSRIHPNGAIRNAGCTRGRVRGEYIAVEQLVEWQGHIPLYNGVATHDVHRTGGVIVGVVADNSVVIGAASGLTDSIPLVYGAAVVR